jgi:putative FmdB family regulatory protein
MFGAFGSAPSHLINRFRGYSMPLYDYHCTECEWSFEKNFKMIDCDVPTTQPCPKCSSLTVNKTVTSAGIGDPVRIGVTRAPADFQKYVLGRIKEAHPLGNVERSRSIVREI